MAYPGGWRKENSPVKNFLTTGTDLLALRIGNAAEKRYKSSDRSEFVFEKHLRARTNLGSTTREAIKKPLIQSGFFINGVPGGIRTHDPRRRRPILYPTELRVHNL